MERLFTHPENQTVLWNIIQRSGYWNDFSRVSKQPPEEWFRRCIETQYRRICAEIRATTPELSKKEWLLLQNKETIRAMTAEMTEVLRPRVGQSSSGQSLGGHSLAVSPLHNVGPVDTRSYSTVEESPTLVYSSSRNYDIPPISAFDMEQERKAKYDKAKMEFEQYQSQYNRLLQPLTPPAPDFSDNAQQSKIGNMEELLIIQQKMRETDYDMFSPPPPKSVPNTDRDYIRKEVVEVIDKNIDYKTAGGGFASAEKDTDKKSVSWSPALFTP